jgi:hypothetical protein
MRDCSRTLGIWSINSKYGVTLEDKPPLMRCPYPKYVPEKSHKDQQRPSVDVLIDEEIPHKNPSLNLIHDGEFGFKRS